MEANLVLASWSNLLIYSAMAVYALSFIIYSLDLVGAGKKTAAPAKAKAAAVTVRRTSRSGGGGVALAERPEEPAEPGELAAPVKGDRRWARAGTGLLTIAAILHVAAVLTRTFAVMRVPWGNMMEYGMVASAAGVLTYLVALKFKDLRVLGTFVAMGGLIVLGLCITVFYTEAAQLIPALVSYWMWIHVPIAILSTALLYVSAGATLFQMLRAWWEKRTYGVVAGSKGASAKIAAAKKAQAEGAAAGTKVPRALAFLERVPASDSLETFAYRLAAVGFVTWTFTLLAGAVWAEVAWGRPWGWDTKEIWTFIVWVVYAAYLHARATRGWSQTSVAVLNLVGFATVLFNFAVVNVYFNGLHSYSGL